MEWMDEVSGSRVYRGRGSRSWGMLDRVLVAMTGTRLLKSGACVPSLGRCDGLG